MSESRRSRFGWSDPMACPPSDSHEYRLPRSARLGLIMLTAAVALLLVAVGFLFVGLYQAREYIEGRGEYRDREAARMESETVENDRRLACDLLDTLPEGLRTLDRARAKYECGPGIPADQLEP